MKFENGKYYLSDKGRRLAVIGLIESIAFGPLLVTEDKQHDLTFLPVDHPDIDGEWVEIAKDEWNAANHGAECIDCGLQFNDREEYLLIDDGPIHKGCFEAQGVTMTNREASCSAGLH